MRVNMGQPNDLLIEDLELLLREIDEFNSATGNNKPVDIPQTLENYLQFVAKSGNTVFPWPHVRTLFRSKMVSAIQQFQEPICPTEGFVLERFDLFRLAAPFTVQRLTELILQPTRHYRKKEKFLRGLEKTVLVVSTIEPRSLTGEEEKNGNDDVVNTSTSSCEAEPDNANFNRAFSAEQQNTMSVHSTPIDVISENMAITTDGIVLDPVTTSAISGVDVISQSITATVASETIIGDAVTTSGVNVITSDIISVTSESIILNPVSESATAEIMDVTSNDALNTPMECESSTATVDVTPVTLLQCVTEQDLVSTALNQASAETLPQTDNVNVLEDVSPSLVNMDAVKLPLEESCTVAPADPQVTQDGESLFQCVNVVESTIIEAPSAALVNPQVHETEDTTAMEEDSKNVEEDSEPAIEASNSESSDNSNSEQIEEVEHSGSDVLVTKDEEISVNKPEDPTTAEETSSLSSSTTTIEQESQSNQLASELNGSGDPTATESIATAQAQTLETEITEVVIAELESKPEQVSDETTITNDSSAEAPAELEKAKEEGESSLEQNQQ